MHTSMAEKYTKMFQHQRSAPCHCIIHLCSSLTGVLRGASDVRSLMVQWQGAEEAAAIKRDYQWGGGR